MTIRLINVKTLQLKSFTGSTAPPYAILSHTWEGNEEVSFQEMRRILKDPSHKGRQKSGYRKIWETCRESDDHGIDYAWIDTCCINKESSAELSEAINSMFRWYRDAAVCFAYLSDYSLGRKHAGRFKECKWFTRGWCLQELIAPKRLIFYDKDWAAVGSKSNLIGLVASITLIDRDVLDDHEVMYSLPVARRMSWASSRTLTRVEDYAYCLLGIFDIHMPLVYGEGEKAFVRLQEEIIRRFNDTSIFLFTPQTSSASRSSFSIHTVQSLVSTDEASDKLHGDGSKSSATDYLRELSSYQFCGMFANSPADFSDCGDIVQKHGSRASFDRQAFSVTNRGLQLGRQFLCCNPGKHCFTWDTTYRHNHMDHAMGGIIFLRKVGRNLFARVLLPAAGISQAQNIFHEGVCVILNMTPSTQYQIQQTLKTVLRFHTKDHTGLSVSLSQQTPMDIWDESGQLFLFPELSFRTSFTGSVRIGVRGREIGPIGIVNFHLRFQIQHIYPEGREAFVLLDREPVREFERPHMDDEDAFDDYLRTDPNFRKSSAQSRLSFDGTSVNARIYEESAQVSGTQMLMCVVEVSRSQDTDATS